MSSFSVEAGPLMKKGDIFSNEWKEQFEALEYYQELCREFEEVSDLVNNPELNPQVIERIVGLLLNGSESRILQKALNLVCGFATLGSEFSDVLIQYGAVTKLVDLLQIDEKPIIVQASLECLGNLASSNIRYRDYILNTNIIVAMRQFCSNWTVLSPQLQSIIAWFLSTLFRGQPAPSMHLLKKFPDILVSLLLFELNSQNEEILDDIISCLCVCCELQPLSRYTADSGQLRDNNLENYFDSCVADIISAFGNKFDSTFITLLSSTTSNHLQRSVLKLLCTMVTSANPNEMALLVQKVPIIHLVKYSEFNPSRLQKEVLSIVEQLLGTVDLHSLTNKGELVPAIQELLSHVDEPSKVVLQQLISRLSS